MGGSWISTGDFRRIIQLHGELNPGLFLLADEYEDLRPTHLRRGGCRCWLYHEDGSVLGIAIVGRDPSLPGQCFDELWCECTGHADLAVQGWDGGDQDRLALAKALAGRLSKSTGRPVFIRGPPDNPFVVLLAKRYRLPFVGTMLLSVRRPGALEVPSLPPGYTIRPYRPGDEVAYDVLCRECFNEALGPEVFRRWVRQRDARAFSAVHRGRVVGQITADVRRGGRLGDFNLAVASVHRGRGLGSALLARAMEYYGAGGVEKVIADHWGENAAAVAFYRRHGFVLERSYNYFVASDPLAPH